VPLGLGLLAVGVFVWFRGDFVQDDTTFIQAALDFVDANGKGELLAEAGIYLVSATLIIQPINFISGAGKSATIFKTPNNQVVFQLGTDTGIFQFACGLNNLSIIFGNDGAGGGSINSVGIRVLNGNATNLHDIDIQSQNVDITMTNIGIQWDTGVTAFGSIFQFLTNITCTHVKTSYSVESPVGFGTSFFARNCTAFGDNSSGLTSSVGWSFNPSTGSGSLISGGNIENCGTATLFKAGGHGVTFSGTRFEANTVDAEFEATADGMSFIGTTGLEPSRITNNAGTGFGHYTLLGCVDLGGISVPDTVSGFKTQVIAKQPGVSGTPYNQTFSFAGNTMSPYIEYKNSAGTVLYRVNPTGGVEAFSGVFTGIVQKNGTHPAFVATLVSAPATNVTGSGTAYTLVTDSEIFDQGANIAGGVFTAPVTGKYNLSAIFQLTGITAAATTIDMRIVTSNRSWRVHLSGAADLTGGVFNPSGSALVDMDANDTATTQIIVSGESSDVVDVGNNADSLPVTYFSGELVA